MKTFLALFDDHAAEVLLVVAIGLVLSGCISQPDKGFETRVSIPVTGEVVFQ